jgi:hypothetical protein
MRIRTIRALLWTSGGIGVAMSAAALCIARWLPLETPTVPAGPLRYESAGTNTDAPVPSLAQIEQLASLDLRRPLYDTPAAAAAPAQRPPLALKLAGTIVEPGHSRAVLVGPEGKVELKSVGQSVAGAEVLRIDPESVTVRYLDQEVQLTLQREKGGR